MPKTRIKFLYLLLFSWIDTSEAQDCSTSPKAPIYVDIHRRYVQGSRQLQYGSYVGVGSPSQNMSLWPSLRQNDTVFAEWSFCGKSNLTDCEEKTGGRFDPSLSDTQVNLKAIMKDH
jgi:hypothetical protein